jgi:hypothetical protein
MLVIGIFKASVFLYLYWISKTNIVAFGYQQVDQPVPVVCRLNDDACNVFFVRFQRIENDLWIVCQLPLIYPFAVFIDDTKVRIV